MTAAGGSSPVLRRLLRVRRRCSTRLEAAAERPARCSASPTKRSPSHASRRSRDSRTSRSRPSSARKQHGWLAQVVNGPGRSSPSCDRGRAISRAATALLEHYREDVFAPRGGRAPAALPARVHRHVLEAEGLVSERCQDDQGRSAGSKAAEDGRRRTRRLSRSCKSSSGRSLRWMRVLSARSATTRGLGDGLRPGGTCACSRGGSRVACGEPYGPRRARQPALRRLIPEPSHRAARRSARRSHDGGGREAFAHISPSSDTLAPFKRMPMPELEDLVRRLQQAFEDFALIVDEFNRARSRQPTGSKRSTDGRQELTALPPGQGRDRAEHPGSGARRLDSITKRRARLGNAQALGGLADRARRVDGRVAAGCASLRAPSSERRWPDFAGARNARAAVRRSRSSHWPSS